MVKLRLAENFRAVFYAPFYAMRVLRMADHEGVDVEWLPPGAPGGAIEDVKRGAVDLTWGGPMRVMKDHDNTPDDGARLVCFGEVVARDAFCLVGASGQSGFTLRDLARLRFGLVSEVPTPWLCLQADLRAAGLDPDKLDCVRGLGMAEQLAALEAGRLDVIQCFEPFISQALAAGSGQVLYAASTRGPTVYTTFICSRDGLVRHRDAFAALDRALGRTLDWLALHGASGLARITAPFFPEIPAPLFESAIRRYAEAGIWARTTAVSREGFDRLAASLLAGGFIATPMEYAHCVHVFETPPHPA